MLPRVACQRHFVTQRTESDADQVSHKSGQFSAFEVLTATFFRFSKITLVLAFLQSAAKISDLFVVLFLEKVPYFSISERKKITV